MLLALCLLSASYAADLKPVGSADISAQVDVPLYAGIDTWDSSYYVEVKVGEKAALLKLVTGDDRVLLSKAGAKALGITFKGAEGSEKATADLMLGTVKLAGTHLGLGSGERGEFSFDSSSRAMPYMGQIGLAAFPELAYAILPSEGVLRLNTAANGGALVSALGGNALEFTSQAAEKFHLGAGPKYEVQDTPYIVKAAWSGAELPTVLAFGGRTWLTQEVEKPAEYQMKDHSIPQVTLPAAPSFLDGQYLVQWRQLTVGAVSGWTYLARIGFGPAAFVRPNAQLGQDFLAGMELAVDPTGHKLALRKAAALKLADYRATYESTLKKALEPAPTAAGATPPPEEDQKKAKLAATRTLANWYYNSGHPDQAAPLYQQVVDGDASQCTDWINLANAKNGMDQFGDALAAVRKAAELYEPWAALSLKERGKQQKAYDDAQKAKKEWTGTVPQDGSCHVAHGMEAQNLLMMQDYAGVAALYPAKLDLDYTLPLTAGNALLLQGKTEEALAAYQQSVALLRTASPWARIGIMLTARNWEQAQAQVEGSRGDLLLISPTAMRAYLATATRFGGPDAAMKEVERLLVNRPANPTLLLAKASILKQQNKDTSATLAELQKWVDEFRSQNPRASWVHAVTSEMLLLQGKAAEAKAEAELAIAADRNDMIGWVALVDAETALGDANAAEHKKHLANSLNPANVLLLK